MRFNGTIPILAAVFLLLAAPHARAQDPPQESTSKPASPPNDMKPKSPAKQKKDSATQNAPDQPTWDPLRAEKDLEVGQFYMKRGAGKEGPEETCHQVIPALSGPIPARRRRRQNQKENRQTLQRSRKREKKLVVEWV